MITLPLISIVIPTYNRKDKLYRLINSINNNNYPKNKVEIIVVDDSPLEDNYWNINSLFPSVKRIKNSMEKWVSASRNIGIIESCGSYIFLVDDDNVLDENTLMELINIFLKDSQVGIAAPIMFYLNEPTTIWCAGVRRNKITSKTKYLYQNQKKLESLPDIIDSEDFPNSFMVRKDVIEEIGLFDELNFPIHYEEADFCKRARDSGWKVVAIRRSKIWHDIVQPNRFLSFNINWKEKRIYYTARNRILFHKKHSGFYEYLIFLFIFLPLFTLYYLIAILISESKTKMLFTISYLKGVLDGILLKV